jgi:nitrite reductase/ring-hydroxylating ferredoxin subunit
MTREIDVAALSAVPEGEARGFEVEGEEIVLCNVDGEIYALQGMCTHEDLPLDGGEVEDGVLTCEWHGAAFDVCSGAAGVFTFTALMVSREGMETALLLFQVRQARLLAGAALGLLGAVAMAWLWARVGHVIDLRRFFQVTGIFLLIFVVQIAITAFHELAEAGVLPDSQALHAATEPYGPEGVYGRWLALVMVGTPALWLAAVWVIQQLHGRSERSSAA